MTKKQRTEKTAKKRRTQKITGKYEPEISKHKKHHSHQGRKTKRRKKSISKRQWKKKLLFEVLLSAGITVVLFGLMIFFTMDFPQVSGYSMTPTVNDRDRLVVFKHQKIRRFDLVEIRHPRKKNETMILRVIGRPGEQLYYKNEQLFINDEEQVERFISYKTTGDEGIQFTQDFTLEQVTKKKSIPAGKYFLLGDNRIYATDSRYFGLVDQKDIIGKVEARLFPIDAMEQF